MKCCAFNKPEDSYICGEDAVAIWGGFTVCAYHLDRLVKENVAFHKWLAEERKQSRWWKFWKW